jgi:FKBP-type peptidyl-prolyl cis-trans isomerase (trigger factor)
LTDRLSLTNALADANIDRQKAERIATEIFDAIHDNVATKQDLQLLRTELEAKIDLVRHQLLTRLGGLIVAVAGLLFAALHYWPPHG